MLGFVERERIRTVVGGYSFPFIFGLYINQQTLEADDTNSKNKQCSALDKVTSISV